MGEKAQKALKTTLSKIDPLRLARKACRAPSRTGEQNTFFDLLTRFSPTGLGMRVALSTLAALGYSQLGVYYVLFELRFFPHCH